MNATAVLPAGAAMAFAGNAATISDAAIADNSAPGGFSEMLGAMVSGSRQSAGKSADTPATEGQTAMPGEILSGLTELEQSAEELKQLLKTAELAGYMQTAVVRRRMMLRQRITQSLCGYLPTMRVCSRWYRLWYKTVQIGLMFGRSAEARRRFRR